MKHLISALILFFGSNLLFSPAFALEESFGGYRQSYQDCEYKIASTAKAKNKNSNIKGSSSSVGGVLLVVALSQLGPNYSHITGASEIISTGVVASIFLYGAYHFSQREKALALQIDDWNDILKAIVEFKNGAEGSAISSLRSRCHANLSAALSPIDSSAVQACSAIIDDLNKRAAQGRFCDDRILRLVGTNPDRPER